MDAKKGWETPVVIELDVQSNTGNGGAGAGDTIFPFTES